jgi:SAM-dependent methyltransferase
MRLSSTIQTLLSMLPPVAGGYIMRNSSSFHTFTKGMNDAAWKAHIELQQSKFHQSEEMRIKIRAIDIGRQNQVAHQFEKSAADGVAGVHSFRGESVLCLGARLGGEVRAFKSLGALAIGVDLEPGKDNMDVVVGDFENLAFPDATFSFAYSNVLDHLHNLHTFAAEACRVIKPGGFLFAALFSGKGDRWNGRQGVSADSYEPLTTAMSPMFKMVEVTRISEIMNVPELVSSIHKRPKIITGRPKKLSLWQQEITTLYLKRSVSSCH